MTLGGEMDVNNSWFDLTNMADRAYGESQTFTTPTRLMCACVHDDLLLLRKWVKTSIETFQIIVLSQLFKSSRSVMLKYIQTRESVLC